MCIRLKDGTWENRLFFFLFTPFFLYERELVGYVGIFVVHGGTVCVQGRERITFSGLRKGAERLFQKRCLLRVGVFPLISPFYGFIVGFILAR